jgi:hypothetical protein
VTFDALARLLAEFIGTSQRFFVSASQSPTRDPRSVDL